MKCKEKILAIIVKIIRKPTQIRIGCYVLANSVAIRSPEKLNYVKIKMNEDRSETDATQRSRHARLRPSFNHSFSQIDRQYMLVPYARILSIRNRKKKKNGNKYDKYGQQLDQFG